MELGIPNYVHGSDSSCVTAGIQGGNRVGLAYVLDRVWDVGCNWI